MPSPTKNFLSVRDFAVQLGKYFGDLSVAWPAFRSPPPLSNTSVVSGVTLSAIAVVVVSGTALCFVDFVCGARLNAQVDLVLYNHSLVI
jgi:hypothetical protein